MTTTYLIFLRVLTALTGLCSTTTKEAANVRRHIGVSMSGCPKSIPLLSTIATTVQNARCKQAAVRGVVVGDCAVAFA